MNLVRPLLAVLALTLGSCSGPPPLKPLPAPPALPQSAAPSPRKPAATAATAESGEPGHNQASPNYEREERGEYRTGYDIGSRDAAYGYPSDPGRAFERFGHDLETPFHNGYVDGYARRAPRY